MARYMIVSLAAFSLLCNTGCVAKQFAHDGVAIHKAMTNIYAEQVMTNLIRAKCDLPFVQLTYSKITLNNKEFGKGNLGTDQTVSTPRDLFINAATRTLTNVYTFGLGADENRTMSFNADPVLAQNDIYGQYQAFAHNPSLFAVSDKAPSCPVHIMRKHDHRYYWVPLEAGPEFLALVLRTTLMRGPETPPAIPAAYEATILDVLNAQHVKDKSHDYYNATLVLSINVPNDYATLIVDLKDGRRVKFSGMPVDDVQVAKATSKLDAQWPPDFTDKELKGQIIRVYSFDHPPETWRPAGKQDMQQPDAGVKLGLPQ